MKLAGTHYSPNRNHALSPYVSVCLGLYSAPCSTSFDMTGLDVVLGGPTIYVARKYSQGCQSRPSKHYIVCIALLILFWKKYIYLGDSFLSHQMTQITPSSFASSYQLVFRSSSMCIFCILLQNHAIYFKIHFIRL